MSDKKNKDYFKKHLETAYRELSEELISLESDKNDVENTINLFQVELIRLNNEIKFIKETINYIYGPQKGSSEHIFELQKEMYKDKDVLTRTLKKYAARHMSSEDENQVLEMSKPLMGPTSRAVIKVLKEASTFLSKGDIEKRINTMHPALNTKFLSQTLKKMREKGSIASVMFNRSRLFVFHGLNEWTAGDQVDLDKLSKVLKENENIDDTTMRVLE